MESVNIIKHDLERSLRLSTVKSSIAGKKPCNKEKKIPELQGGYYSGLLSEVLSGSCMQSEARHALLPHCPLFCGTSVGKWIRFIFPSFPSKQKTCCPGHSPCHLQKKISRVSQTREISITGSWAERKVHFLQFHRGIGGAYTSTKAHLGVWRGSVWCKGLLKDLQAKSTAPMRVCKLRPEQLNHLGRVAKDGQSS